MFERNRNKLKIQLEKVHSTRYSLAKIHLKLICITFVGLVGSIALLQYCLSETSGQQQNVGLTSEHKYFTSNLLPIEQQQQQQHVQFDDHNLNTTSNDIPRNQLANIDDNLSPSESQLYFRRARRNPPYESELSPAQQPDEQPNQLSTPLVSSVPESGLLGSLQDGFQTQTQTHNNDNDNQQAWSSLAEAAATGAIAGLMIGEQVSSAMDPKQHQHLIQIASEPVVEPNATDSITISEHDNERSTSNLGPQESQQTNPDTLDRFDTNAATANDPSYDSPDQMPDSIESLMDSDSKDSESTDDSEHNSRDSSSSPSDQSEPQSELGDRTDVGPVQAGELPEMVAGLEAPRGDRGLSSAMQNAPATDGDDLKTAAGHHYKKKKKKKKYYKVKKVKKVKIKKKVKKKKKKVKIIKYKKKKKKKKHHKMHHHDHGKYYM